MSPLVPVSARHYKTLQDTTRHYAPSGKHRVTGRHQLAQGCGGRASNCGGVVTSGHALHVLMPGRRKRGALISAARSLAFSFCNLPVGGVIQAWFTAKVHMSHCKSWSPAYRWVLFVVDPEPAICGCSGSNTKRNRRGAGEHDPECDMFTVRLG